jgi:3-dehydroquinate dehydratase-2
VEYFQSNHEGRIIDKIHESMGSIDHFILNPGALTHYSYSLHDAILAAKIPVIEVHISNIFTRDDWRAKSVISPAADGVISGFGLNGYMMALESILKNK